MRHTRIKICGITRSEDALLAAELGADAIGLVFFSQSPRCVSIQQAQKIIAELPAFVTTVGLFVNAPKAEITQVLDQLPLDLLQFHGNESPDECAGYDRPYIKALHVTAEVDLAEQVQRYSSAKAVLLDSYHPHIAGGTGMVFEWDKIPAQLSKPIILAGGLNPGNVSAAISQVHPFAVDVSSGVEATPGIKDREKLIAFIREVRHADIENN